MTKETDREKEAKKHLNQKQRTFAQEYMKCNNITQSAITAGYSKKTASVQGCNLLKNPRVLEYINSINERLESSKIADIQEVMEYLTSVMRGEEKDQFDLEPSLADRTKAATELCRRLDVKSANKPVEARVVIVNDIPRPSKKMEVANNE